MQDNQEVKNEGNSSEEEVVESQEATSEKAEAAADQAESQEKTVELDPWEQLELEAAKWKDQAIRTAAELDNYRKRMSREKLDAVRYGNQGLLEELLPVLDNFDIQCSIWAWIWCTNKLQNFSPAKASRRSKLLLAESSTPTFTKRLPKKLATRLNLKRLFASSARDTRWVSAFCVRPTSLFLLEKPLKKPQQKASK